MRNSVIWSFFSIAALAAGGLLSGCDSDDAIAKSGAGESCDRTSDCADGLKCLEGTCYGTQSGGGSGNEGGADGSGGTTVVGPKPEVLGGEGESCTKRADCEDGLGCFNERCTKSGEGEGGEGNVPGVVLGKEGETCATTTDCSKGLICLPGGVGQPAPIGYLGVCTQATGKYVPSGKLCGAECLEDADCHELPVELHVAYSLATAPYGTGANSCSELISLLDGVDCDSAAITAAQKAQCFALAAYCETDDSWTCEAGACKYVAECSESGAVPGGCPSYTRSGVYLQGGTANCNVDTDLCEPDTVVVTGCKKDADCNNKTTQDTGENCTAGECTCYRELAQCYRKCDSTLDCAAGYQCDTDTSVCVPEGECTTNEECAITKGPKYACIDNTCQQGCTTDYECNGGAITSTASTVCVGGVCTPIGCSADSQCAKTVTVGLATQVIHMFCTTPEAAPAVPVVASAITD